MCGLVGYMGERPALPIILEGLRRMEYRGYDSAGVALVVEGKLHAAKKQGRLEVLEEELAKADWPSGIGIGHSRWASHGQPSDANAHPHADCSGHFMIVHNGIIENFRELRAELKAKGHRFTSETDTEVIPHLIEELYAGDLEQAFQGAIERLRGAYALVLVSDLHPDRLYAYRQASPLVVGLGADGNFVASDIPALLPYTREMYLLEDGELAILSAEGVQVKAQGKQIEKEIFHVDWDPVAAEKGGYEHFMLKEIHEQPQAIQATYAAYLESDGGVNLAELGLTPESARALRKLTIVACGTSFHAGLVGKYVIERLARIPVEVDIASEFRYRNPLISEGDAVLVISQSGETADTLAALREAKRLGAQVWAITNVLGSSVAREADAVLPTSAGPEIAVASTKAYTTQLIVLTLMAIHLAELRGEASGKELASIAQSIRDLPALLEEPLRQGEQLRVLAKALASHEDVFFMGRGLDYAGSLEAALKLKEISYIHAEALAAGELKHGPLALITQGTPVVCLLTQPDLREKMESNMEEVSARGGEIFLFDTMGDRELERLANWRHSLPLIHPVLGPILAIVPLQLLAYFVATERGCDVDKPRNLAKSVTIE